MISYYLDTDHPSLQAPAVFAAAKRVLVTRCLQRARRFVLQRASSTGETVPRECDLCSGNIEESNKGELQRLFETELTEGAEDSSESIRSCRLMDASEHTLLRVGNHGSTILFWLADADLPAVLDELGQHGVSSEAIVQLADVDMEVLER